MRHRPGLGMRHRLEEAARPQVLAGGDLRVVHDRRHADAVLLGRAIEVQRVPLGHELLHELVEDVAVLGPPGVGGEYLQRRPVRASHEFHQTLPLVLLDADDEHEPVLRPERPPRDQPARMEALQRRAAIGVDGNAGFEHGRGVRLLREVDELADTGALRFRGERERRHGPGGARHQCALMAEDLERRQRRIVVAARRQARPAAGVGDDQFTASIVLVRSAVAERRDAEDDELRPLSQQALGIDP